MAFDAFLKIDGIVGESTDVQHKAEIDVLSFSWGASQPGVSGSNTPNSKVSISNFSIVKVVDQASPQLLSSSCAGGLFPTAVLSVRKLNTNPDGTSASEFLKVTMSDVFVSGISAGGNKGNDPMPLEQISFNFSKIEMAVVSSTGATFAAECGSPAFQKIAPTSE